MKIRVFHISAIDSHHGQEELNAFLNAHRVTQVEIRGGGWNSNARNVRAANRNGNANDPGNRNHNVGVRLSQAPESVVRLRMGLAMIAPMTRRSSRARSGGSRRKPRAPACW